jgi:hypothetical protein
MISCPGALYSTQHSTHACRYHTSFYIVFIWYAGKLASKSIPMFDNIWRKTGIQFCIYTFLYAENFVRGWISSIKHCFLVYYFKIMFLSSRSTNSIFLQKHTGGSSAVDLHRGLSRGPIRGWLLSRETVEDPNPIQTSVGKEEEWRGW